MKKKKKGYFLIIDPQKNTLRISTEDDWLIENIVKNTANIKKNKTVNAFVCEMVDNTNMKIYVFDEWYRTGVTNKIDS